MKPLQTYHGLKTPPPFADHPAGTGSERAPLHVSGGNPVQRQPGKGLGALQSRCRITKQPSSQNRAPTRGRVFVQLWESRLQQTDLPGLGLAELFAPALAQRDEVFHRHQRGELTDAFPERIRAL